MVVAIESQNALFSWTSGIRLARMSILLDLGMCSGFSVCPIFCSVVVIRRHGESRTHSPLSSLSSLDDVDEQSDGAEPLSYDLDDYDLAEVGGSSSSLSLSSTTPSSRNLQLLCNFQLGQPGWKKTRVNASVQTEPEDVPSTPLTISIPVRNSRPKLKVCRQSDLLILYLIHTTNLTERNELGTPRGRVSIHGFAFSAQTPANWANHFGS
jgi:hypothetical protein